MKQTLFLLLALLAAAAAGCTTTEHRVEHHYVTVAPITIEPIKVEVDATIHLQAVAPPAEGMH
jgi:type IV pilus biogenesis protein CpaD/CtpE